MATNQKCGYCEETGHRKPVCPMFHEQRRTVWTTTVHQRKELIDTMCTLGMGAGALFTYHNYGNDVSCMMLDPAAYVDDFNFFKFGNIKYSKRVTVTNMHYADAGAYASYKVKAMKLSNGIEQIVALNYRHLMTGGWKGAGNKGWWGNFEILSPSTDMAEINEAAIESKIPIDARLIVKGEKTNCEWNKHYLKKNLVQL